MNRLSLKRFLIHVQCGMRSRTDRHTHTTKELLKNFRKDEIREESLFPPVQGLIVSIQELLEEVRKELQKMKEEIIEGEELWF